MLGEFAAEDTMPINGSGGYVEGNKIAITFEAYSPVKGEIIIAFTETALKAIYKELQFHTHTYSYTSDGKAGHYTTATCGCPSEEGTSPHYDGDTDYFCDFCKCDMTEFADEWQYDETYHWYVSDDSAVYCYGEHENGDADLNCDICGYLMYEPTPTNHFLRNQAGCEWMNGITAEDIAEIKITEEAVGVAPGALKNITSSTDRSVIADIFEKYYWMDTAPIADVYGEIDGGGAVTVDFVLKNGEVKELHFNNGNYRDANGAWFEPLYIPKFSYGTDFIGYYGFVTYTGKGAIGKLLGGDDLGVEPLWLCEFPMNEIEFGEVEIDFGETEPVPTHIVETEFGALMFIDHSIFYINGDSGYYYLVGKNLDELIEEYSCIAE